MYGDLKVTTRRAIYPSSSGCKCNRRDTDSPGTVEDISTDSLKPFTFNEIMEAGVRQVSIETCPANQSLGTPFMVVNGNYRLGPFGFGYGQQYLSDGASNSGLWDVLAVFDWVAANIASFGGNADHVTLAGQSAGAVSASLMAFGAQSA